MDYRFRSIRLNQREVLIADIMDGSVLCHDAFEESTTRFIKSWLSGGESFLLHTSGSTGPAKPIEIHRHQMEASAHATISALDLQPGSRALVCLDTRFIAGQMMLVRSLINDMEIEAVSPSANPLEERNWGKNIQFVAFVPYQLNVIVNSRQAAHLDRIEKIIIGGAPLSRPIEQALDKFRCTAYMTYGMTETISHIALRAVNGARKTNLYTTLPGIRVSIDDRSCLIVDCPYIRDKVVTNDMVRLINATTFEWTGRFDNVINTGGVKVSAERVEETAEAVIRSFNLHGGFVISSMPDEVLGEKVVLVIEAKSLDKSIKEMILVELYSLLPRYYAPKELVTLDEFPLTSTGKTDRVQIRNLLSKRQ
jgi:o-succinylbenzoate---CoA ligase